MISSSMAEAQTSNFSSLDSESKEREFGNRTPLLFETEIPGFKALLIS
jgi:hypothetical protein